MDLVMDTVKSIEFNLLKEEDEKFRKESKHLFSEKRKLELEEILKDPKSVWGCIIVLSSFMYNLFYEQIAQVISGVPS